MTLVPTDEVQTSFRRPPPATETVANLSSDTDLRDRDLVQKINDLRRIDNTSSWRYLALEYVYLGCVLAAALWCWHAWFDGQLSGTALGIVLFATVVLVGIGQHRLVMLGHEASHYALFGKHWLNDLVSDLLCFFPIWITTYNYRLQHMMHHQYTNDADRDPDMAYMVPCGQQYRHPISSWQFWWRCIVKPAFWIPNQIRFLLIRIRLALLTGVMARYRRPEGLPGRLILAVAVVAQLVFLEIARRTENANLVWIGGALVLTAVLIAVHMVPKITLIEGTMKPAMSPRWSLFARLAYIVLLTSGMVGMQITTGRPWILFYLVLWVLPLATTFSFLMVLREDIQHSNTGVGRFQNTRDAQVPLLVRWAVFPFGMHLHLAHHLYSMVPHYRLPELDNLLQQSRRYREERVVIGVSQMTPTDNPVASVGAAP
jgi:fatty acid desaturase